MSLYAFHLGQIISTVLGQVDHGGHDGNAARTRIRDGTSKTDHTQKPRFRHGDICRIIKALAILRCLYSSEMVILGVVITKFETPTTNRWEQKLNRISFVSLITNDYILYLIIVFLHIRSLHVSNINITSRSKYQQIKVC